MHLAHGVVLVGASLVHELQVVRGIAVLGGSRVGGRGVGGGKEVLGGEGGVGIEDLAGLSFGGVALGGWGSRRRIARS